jgi:hypothetical protein
MLQFQHDITKLIKNLCAKEVENILPSISLPYPLLYIPSKQLAFQLIPIPHKNVELEQQYFLQSLSLKAKQQNIRLINLSEDYFYTKSAIVTQRVASLLGVFTRIHARNTTVKRIDKKLLDDFLINNNLYESPTARYKYGLFEHDKLVAVASFSAGRPIERDGKVFRSFELVRFANLSGYIVAGGLSKLVNHFIKDVGPDDIMSYADLDWSSGTSYEKLGFRLDNITPPQAFWINPQEKIRYYPHKLPQELVNKSIERGISIEEILSERKYYRFFNSGNLKYLLIL